MESKPKPTAPGLDLGDLVTRVVKYILEGLAVAVAAALFPPRTRCDTTSAADLGGFP